MYPFVSEASLWDPELLTESGWVEHGPFAFWLMEAHRPRILVELGTHHGYSYFAFNQALKRLGAKSRCFAVDTWQGDEHAGYYGDEIFKKVSAHNHKNYWDFSELIRSTFDEALDQFEDASIDLLHIDGRHFYEDANHDLTAWKPKLSSRGVLMLHDTNVRIKDFGVYRLWDELKAEYPYFEFLHGHGLGVLGVGTDLPERVTALFKASCDPALTEKIRTIYFRLGERLSERVEKDKLSAELLQQPKLREELERVQAYSLHLEEDLQRVSAIEHQRQELDLELQELRNQLSNAQTELDKSSAELAERNTGNILLTNEHKHTAQQLERTAKELLCVEDLLKTEVLNRNRMQADLWREVAELNRIRGSASWQMMSVLRSRSSKMPAIEDLFGLPIRLLWWTTTFQLVHRVRLAKASSFILDSGGSGDGVPGNRIASARGVKLGRLLRHLAQTGSDRYSPQVLFDRDWYLQQNPDVAVSGRNPLTHYLDYGWKERRDPHPVFDTDWYLQQNLDVASSGRNPLLHYLTCGWKEGRSPHPLFDADWYLAQYPDVAASGRNPLMHYLESGWKEGRDPHPLFDTAFYLQQNREALIGGVNPLAHYLSRGAVEGRSPHWLFDSPYYLRLYSDVAGARVDPLQHYLQSGAAEARIPHPLFDPGYYSKNSLETKHSGLSPLEHYARTQTAHRRSPHPLFDIKYYLRDLGRSVGKVDPLRHFIYQGGMEGVDPSPFFDSSFYLKQYPVVAKAGINPLIHFLVDGAAQGYYPSPSFDTLFYLDRSPDVVESAVNPLVHYVLSGLSEERPPNRLFGKEYATTLPIIGDQKQWEKFGRNRLSTLISSDDKLVFPASGTPKVSIILVFRNKAHLSVLCLDTILANAGSNYDLIIVDNNSTDDTSVLLDRCKGAHVIRNPENVGFGEACMMGAAKSKAEYLLFLNNDTLLEPGAIARALDNFESEGVGAVGGKLLLANNDLQEAGSILWSDGSAYGYGRRDVPDFSQYEFRRPVDYCSGAFLLTPRTLFLELGGFDPIYSPAYYEDADYCMKLWAADLQVIYEPRSVIRHFESASSDGNESARPLMIANRQKFVERWKDKLSKHCPPSLSNAVRARIATHSTGLRILYLDDRIPHRNLGAGYTRSYDVLHHLLSIGHHLTCVAMKLPIESVEDEYRDVAREIELFDAVREEEKLFRDYVPSADLIWVSRPHNLASFLDGATAFGGFAAKLVYDAEAIYSDRDRLLVNLQNRMVPSRVLDVKERRELALTEAVDNVIVVSPRDQVLMEREGVRNVHVLGHCVVPNPTPACFPARNTFLFVGAMHGSDNPNADSMQYFCREIWPEVHRRTGAELIIAGQGTDRYLDKATIAREGVRVLGPVEDLKPLYNAARVFLAPTRYSAGIPMKVHEAAGNGVPAVVSELIGQQLCWDDRAEILVARDRQEFIDRCCELYTDKALWEALRARSLLRVREELNPEIFRQGIASVLASLEE